MGFLVMRVEELREGLNDAGIELTPYLEDPMIPPRIVAEMGRLQNPLAEVDHPDKCDLSINVFDELPEEQLNEMKGRRRETLDELSKRVKIYGTDALAWYVSYHYDSKWGIYIPFSSLENLRETHYRRSRKAKEFIWSKCLQILLAHEFHHFYIDYIVGRWELFLLSSISQPAKVVVKSSPASYLEIEEAGAEARLLRFVKEHYGSREFKKWSRHVAGGLPGYREGVRSVDPEQFARVIQETVKSYLSVLAPAINLSASVHLSHAIGDSAIPWRDCPIYIIHDEMDVACQPVEVLRYERILIAHETNRFKKAFKRLHPNVQGKWQKKKSEIAERLKPGTLEPLKGQHGQWEIRFNGTKHRAVISPEKASRPLTWVGEKIGTHRDIGTGT